MDSPSSDPSRPSSGSSGSSESLGESSRSRSPAPKFPQRRSYAIIDLGADPSSEMASVPDQDQDQHQDRAALEPSSSYVDSVVPSLTTADTSGIFLRSEAPSYKSDDHASIHFFPRGSITSPESRRSASGKPPPHEGSSLLHPSPSSLAAPEPGPEPWYRGPLLMASIKLAVLFLFFSILVGGTFYYGMPPLDPSDRADMKLPRSFADLQALNALFGKYKTQYPYRILACGVVAYLFVQTFSLPGSMYISILFGAAYGMVEGVVLSCLCDSIGSMLCFTLSALLAPPLLALPFYRARVETWRLKILGDPSHGGSASWDAIFAFLLVLRISPFPPHWVANFVAPHLGISPWLFWLTCFIGIAPVSVIHVTIGVSLDSMTSAADFHILSLRNVLGMGAVIVAVLIPVGLKRVFRKDLGELGEAEAALEEVRVGDAVVEVPPVHHHVLEVDQEGVPRRYQAIDSGVVLAAPSAGDASLHPDSDAERDLAREATKRGGKGKGRAVIIPRIIEPHSAGARKKAAWRGEKGTVIQTYGAVEGMEVMEQGEEQEARYVIYGR